MSSSVCIRPRNDPARALSAGSSRQAIAAAVAALVRTGERLGVEALTYPVVKAIAARLGVSLVPLVTDREGLVPEAVREGLRRARCGRSTRSRRA